MSKSESESESKKRRIRGVQQTLIGVFGFLAASASFLALTLLKTCTDCVSARHGVSPQAGSLCQWCQPWKKEMKWESSSGDLSQRGK